MSTRRAAPLVCVVLRPAAGGVLGGGAFTRLFKRDFCRAA